MHSLEESIDIDVPIRVAYNQWTQFEQFPSFMEGVKEVRQLDDKRLAWRAEILNKEVNWTASITEQVPNDRISWHSTSGPTQNGTIRFHRLGGDKTRLTLRLELEPEGAVAAAGAALGLVSARVRGDLGRFKEFIEGRGTATGQWRGEIRGGQVASDDRSGSVRH
jgi:uncharacterized membrane protein